MCREFVDFKFPNQVDSFECYQDEGFTGANTDRPGLIQLLADVKDGFIDVLVVYQLDRLSRDVRDFSNIYGLLEENGIVFVSIKENIDTTTPIGRAMMYVTMVFAQMERETIAARVTDNMIGLAKKGLWVGGNPPYGYRREPVVVNGKKHVIIVPVPEAAAFVESIYDEFLDGKYSLKTMSATLRKRGQNTPKGALFTTSQLYKLLTMPFCVAASPEIWDYYTNLGCNIVEDREAWDGSRGVMIYGRTKQVNKRNQAQPPSEWTVCIGMHEAFISPEKWLAVQERFKVNTYLKKPKYPMPLLKGVLRCAKCGRLMIRATQKGSHGQVLSSYVCSKRNQLGRDACDMSAIRCNKIDEQVMNVFHRIEADPAVISEYMAAADQTVDTDYSIMIRDLEKKASAVRSRISRLTESLADGSAASKYIIPQIEAEDLSLSELNREIEIAKAEQRRSENVNHSTAERIEGVIRMIKSLDGLSADEKNEIAKSILSECTWDGANLFLRI
jgi:DNA invertase Pin-like site-specific DNA recombinase